MRTAPSPSADDFNAVGSSGISAVNYVIAPLKEVNHDGSCCRSDKVQNFSRTGRSLKANRALGLGAAHFDVCSVLAYTEHMPWFCMPLPVACSYSQALPPS